MASSGMLERDDSTEELRLKYVALARKYAELVARVGRRSSGPAPGPPEAPLPALALWSRGTLRASNSAWRELDASGGLWTVPSASSARAVPDLRALAKVVVERAHGSRVPRLWQHGGRTFRLSVESVQGGRLVLLDDVTFLQQLGRNLRRVHDLLRETDQQRIIVQLASAVAHDLGGTVRSLALELEALIRAPDRLSEAAHRLRDGLGAATAAVRQLLDVARAATMPPSPIDVAPCIDQAVRLATMDYRHPGIDYRIDLGRRKLPRVHGSGVELVHVLLTLLRNAADAMRRGGVVRITAAARVRTVRIAVADRGLGLPRHIRARLFEPFVSTKGTAGAGVGLWLAASAVRRMGGEIEGRNRTPRGAIFTIVLPAIANVRRAGRRPPAAAPAGLGLLEGGGSAPRRPPPGPRMDRRIFHA